MRTYSQIVKAIAKLESRNKPVGQDLQITPQPRQKQFLESDADICLFGGAAGSGKSLSLLLDFAKPELLKLPHYGGVIFRRTYPEIKNEGGLWDESGLYYPQLGGIPNESRLSWKFPSGATVRFSHLQHEKDIYRWQGSQLDRCISKGTLISMADGTFKPIEEISPSEKVKTLQGDRSVVRLTRSGIKKTYKIEVGKSSLVLSEDHPVLTDRGWQSVREMLPEFDSDRQLSVYHTWEQPIRSNGFLRILLKFFLTHSKAHKLSLYLLLGSLQKGQPSQQKPDQSPHEDFYALSEGDRIGSSVSGDVYPKPPQPVKLSCQLALCVPSLRLEEPAIAQYSPACASSHAQTGSEPLDSLSGYRACLHSCGGLSCLGQEYNPQNTRQLNDAALHNPSSDESKDETDNALEDSQRVFYHYEYNHPYTKERKVSIQPLSFFDTYATLAGERECFDLTIEGASHYITHTGIIAQNCGFDEVCHFSRKMVFYLMTRMRSPHLHPQMRLTCNPDAESWLAGFIDWWINPIGYPYPDRSGVKRWFIVNQGDIVWGDTKQELTNSHPGSQPKSFTFISAKLTDNPALLEKDPGYLANLEAQDPVERARLLDGNWRVRKSESRLFDEDAIAACSDGYWQSPVKGRYIISCDPNFGGDDFFEIQVWKIEARIGLVNEWRNNNQSVVSAIAQLISLIDLYNPLVTAVESNSGGKIILERLHSERPGRRIEPVLTTASSKVVLTDRLAIAVLNQELSFPPDWVGISEMKSFSKYTRQALAGHDDAVMAAAVMCAFLDKIKGNVPMGSTSY